MSSQRLKIGQAILQAIVKEDLWGGAGTSRRNHEDCPAGKDTKRRLYTTLKDDGSIVAYCHNCGSAGSTSSTGPRVRRSSSVPVMGATTGTGSNSLPATVALSKRHRLFLRAYGISHPINVASVEDEDAIVFSNTDPLMTAYTTGTIRSFEPRAPKWCKVGGLGFLTYAKNINLIHCIVEDPISAMKLAHLPYVSATAALGTHPSAGAMTPPPNVGTIVVWFDNDSEIVIEAAKKTATSLALRMDDVVLILGVSDPKKYQSDFLNKVLNDADKLSRTPKAPDQSYHVLEVCPPDP